MKLKKLLSIFMVTVLLFGLVSCGNDAGTEDTTGINSTESNTDSDTQQPPKGNGVIDGFIRADGQLLVDEDGDQFLIKGMAFSNNAADNPSKAPTKLIDEQSYKELKELGFNSVRFYLNYGLFEAEYAPYRYKDAAWEWLDKNIAWAKANDIRIVFNMHTPQGGYQSLGEGLELWTNEENQNRLIALWKAIAERYKDETTVIGYGLVNEPIMPWKGNSEDTVAQWQDLAQRITDAIRTVNNNHVIFVERAISARDMSNNNKSVALDDDCKFVLINDSNVVYEYHDYSPSMLTHQGMSWNGTVGKYADYPNDSKQYDRDPSLGTYIGTTARQPSVDVSKSGWQYFEGAKDFYITDVESYNLGIITLELKDIGADGSVYVDDIEVLEYDQNGTLLKTVSVYSFSQDTQFQFWSQNKSGSYAYVANVGHNSNGAIMITGVTGSAKAMDNFDMLYITEGHSYQIRGWVKCDNVNSNATVRLTVDYHKIKEPMPRNIETLEKELLEYIQFGIDNNVPMYLGEFGTSIASFANNLGGDRWVEDMMTLLVKHNVNFNYHTYNEPNGFGLWTGRDSNGYRTDRNEILADTFKRFLVGN